MKNKELILTILSVLLVAILISAGSYAFWVWESDRGNDTNVAFTIQGKNFSCSADGGGNITSNDVLLEPTKCSDTSHTIKREIHANMVNNANQDIRLDLWLNINELDAELANSDNLKWTITDSSEGCNAGTILGSGNFKYRTIGDKQIISQKIYSNSDTDTYYLYIWLDEAETNANTANKSFNFSLGGECTDSNMPNKPYINNSGLIPVKLSDSGDTVTAISEDNPSWYNYSDKKWANAVLVSDTNRSNYQNLTGNTEVNIPTSEILAYYVWIPRYSYKVWQYSGVSAVGQEHEIDIKFVGKSIKEMATGNGEWHTHPAFTFGDTELSGIWVGKFELSHQTLSIDTYDKTQNNLGTDSGDITCNHTECNKYTGIRILPNVQSLKYNRVANFFNASRFMESSGNPFGLVSDKIDSHMIKNSEWGAPAYLSHSRYGKNSEIIINNTNYTGRGSGYSNYGQGINYPQSTTGNVTGIFDMSGLAHEYVMGVYSKTPGNSGFNTTTNLWPDSKYYNNYPNPPFSSSYISITVCTIGYCGGHAINETKNWYNDYMKFPEAGSPWFIRGGYTGSGTSAGAFYVSMEKGASTTTISVPWSTRLVLVEE